MNTTLIKCTLAFVFLLFVKLLSAQVPKRTLDALLATQPIIIDGKLNEPDWQKADLATSFIQYAPQPDSPSTQKTEVSILYDNNAIYIGARLYDNHADSILKQLAARDDYANNNDYFGITFDTYLDNQNGTTFIVTASGVQADGIVKFDGTDWSWNAAWYSKVTINKQGWFVEMKIPYSALRFPKKKVQQWGVNFFRYIRRNRESSYWNTVKPSVPNILSQAGVLTNIHDIESPVRLSFLPYVSAYSENYAGENANTLNGGMDIKYGLSESFTLDMTLIPDFGQTLYDNKVLNLSPIEVRYDDRRYFFTEGLSLFNKDDLFYTRRVGGTPVDYYNVSNFLKQNEIITANPATSKIYNATKISGRTKHKLGIGFFNAVTSATTATIQDTIKKTTREFQTAPFTNYNVLVIDQALKNNSYISFVNTNVNRQNSSYNADVSALLFKFANKTNSYGIDGSTDVSQIYNAVKPDIGYKYYFDISKMSGNYTWYLHTTSISDNYNPNDLGYLSRNNVTNYIFNQNYNIYKPFGKFVNSYNYVELDYYRIFNPNVFYQWLINGSHSLTTKKYISFGAYYSLTPSESYDYLEPRTPGRFYVYPQNYYAGAFISSDYRKKFALDINLSNNWYNGNKRNTFFWAISPRYRFSDKFSMVYSLSGQNSVNDVGYVDNVNDSIYFGIRHLQSITNTLDAAFIFTNTMSLKFDVRHYWSQAYYSKYCYLNTDGKLYTTNYNTNHNVDFNTFNLYLSFVWQYLPGSEMSVVYQNSIYSSGAIIYNNYFYNLNSTLQMPQSNSLSIKVIYYLDYLTLRGLTHKNNS